MTRLGGKQVQRKGKTAANELKGRWTACKDGKERGEMSGGTAATSATGGGGAPAGSGGGAEKRAVSGQEYGERLGFRFESRDDQSIPHNVHRVGLNKMKGNIVQMGKKIDNARS